MADGVDVLLNRHNLSLFREFLVKRFSCHTDGFKEIEFFEPRDPQPAALDPKELVRALGESMPPDSQMLMASSEAIPGVDFPHPEPSHPIPTPGDSAIEP